jgi:uncharacterized delta-60 repeat protein
MRSLNRQFIILLTVVVMLLCALVVSGPAVLQAQTIQVLSADPPSTTQGTMNLNVLIKGKGFKNGAIAKFLVTGTPDTGGVSVNSTSFIDSADLIANINVADAAVLSKYDIQVTNADGRSGKGTELFTVNKKQTACVPPNPVPSSAYCLSGSPGVAGCLDSNFGSGTGRVMIPPGMTVNGLAIQTVAGEDRIVAVGKSADPCTGQSGDWIVTRYHPDGTLDTDFGPDKNGIIKGGYPGGQALASAVVVAQPGNKLVVAGTAPSGKLSYAAMVARYNEDGSPDTTFGTGGVVSVPLGKTGAGWVDAIALQSDGQIVAAGCAAYPCRLAVFRLSASGVLDTSFNTGGTFKGQYIYTAYASEGRSVAIQPLGTGWRIVVAGYVYRTYTSAVLFGLASNGKLDATFGSSGIVWTDFPGSDWAQYFGIALDSSNRLVAVGQTRTGTGMARYDQAGGYDSSFGTDGIVTTSTGEASAVAIQPDGYILVAGTTGNGQAGMTNWRFTPTGAPDTSFGNLGLVNECFSDYCSAFSNALVLASDGTFLSCGGTTTTDGINKYEYAALARYWR